MASPSSPLKGQRAKHPPNRLSGVVIFNLALPFAVFGLASQFTTTLNAMILYTLPPLGKCVYELVRERHVDYISMLQLAITGIAIAVMMYTDDPRVVLLMDIVPPMIIAVVLVGSALWPHGVNLVWLAFRGWYDATHNDVARVDRIWRTDSVLRRRFRAIAIIVGVVVLAEDSVRLYFVYTAPLSTMIVASPIAGITTGVFLTLWIVCSIQAIPTLTKDSSVATETSSLLA
ncbi:hypothetical protein DYB32_007196 [Aphanomyces invadans]|uniref:Uncharacterized protein n=1 Tax=Aphanomyces invadans TaxID=157072 RepID=A0A3R6Z1W1_9STRA|nr:hypothetical protein DYB32_007196 [Aphanomyces invadans]